MVGTFEPTPFADLGNAAISGLRGNKTDAALSLAGVIPYVGDAGKIGKYLKPLKRFGGKVKGFFGKTVVRGSDEFTTALYHGGNLRDGAVQSRRISLTPDVNHAKRYADLNGGQIYQFDVPSTRLRQLELDDGVLRLQDSYLNTGSYASEFRFKPSVAPELNQYLRR